MTARRSNPTPMQPRLIEEPTAVPRQTASVAEPEPPSPVIRAVSWAIAARRRAGTVLVIGFALVLCWHVVTGKNGLTSWEQKRVEDKQLQKEIDSLQVENTQLKDRVDHLKNDPDAIEQEARQQLHYARPNEVIYTLPQKGSSK